MQNLLALAKGVFAMHIVAAQFNSASGAGSIGVAIIMRPSLKREDYALRP